MPLIELMGYIFIIWEVSDRLVNLSRPCHFTIHIMRLHEFDYNDYESKLMIQGLTTIIKDEFNVL